jgi:hypothetical protein
MCSTEPGQMSDQDHGTTQLYDRLRDELSLDEVERIVI